MAERKPRVHVVGTGTIGEPLVYLLAEQRKELGLGRISFHKRSPLVEEVGKVKRMIEAGVIFSADEDKFSRFKEL